MTPHGRGVPSGPLLSRLALVLVALVLVAACGQTGQTSAPSGPPGSPPAASPAPGASPAPSPGASPSPNPAAHPLRPASPGANPVDLLAWLFTPVFQTLFVALVLIDRLVGNMAIAIVILTILIRLLLVPLFRQQLVSQRRLQLVQPEIREIQRRFRGDRLKQQEAIQQFYKERGINPASGCLPILLQFILLIPLYSVFTAGLTNYNPEAMLRVFDFTIVDLNCPATPQYDASGQVIPCLETTAFGIDWSRPEILFPLPFIQGLSGLALLSALLQLVQSRMTLPPSDPKTDDPNVRIQRQMMLFLPLISIFYGAILPAGLFLYWIVTTIFSIVQQYLIIGWGGMFPLFGWHPEWAKSHTPRFPVAVPAPDPTRTKQASAQPTRPITADRAASAAATIRSRGRRQGRRGRRR